MNEKEVTLAERLKLEWYALVWNSNSDKLEKFNIFDSTKFFNSAFDALKKYTNYREFKEEIDKCLMWAFWTKSEYEIGVGSLHTKTPDDMEKIDVYYQVVDNLDILCKYILTEYNTHKRKKLEF